MFDRHWFGDLALAVALVLPLAGISLLQPASSHATAKSTALATTTDRGPAGRISLLS